MVRKNKTKPAGTITKEKKLFKRAPKNESRDEKFKRFKSMFSSRKKTHVPRPPVPTVSAQVPATIATSKPYASVYLDLPHHGLSRSASDPARLNVSAFHHQPISHFDSIESFSTLSGEDIVPRKIDQRRDAAFASKLPNGSAGALEPPDEKEEEQPSTKDILKQRAKLILPHVGLVLISCLYTVLGAAIFYGIESREEESKKSIGKQNIIYSKGNITEMLLDLRNKIPLPGNFSFNITNDSFLPFDLELLDGLGYNYSNGSNLTYFDLSLSEDDIEIMWRHYVTKRLNDFMGVIFRASHHNFVTEKDMYSNESAPMWTFTSALFFSATVITTIGYGHLVPHTLAGRILCMLFGLVGIPLILVTVADMGKFLSEYVIKFHRNSVMCFRWIKRKLVHCFRFCRRHCKSKNKKNLAQSVVDGITIGAATRDKENENENEDRKRLEELRISVRFVLAILVGYTAFGAWLLQQWEEWTFLDSFYYCFITVTTIGFGDIVPKNKNFILITLLYIVTGLVITTMCIDLVGSQYIRKIHYFGQEIRRAKYAFAAMGNKVVHIGEVIRYVTFLQKKYGLTNEELERIGDLPDEYLLDCLLRGKPLPAHLWPKGLGPFIPRDFLQWRWIDQRGSCSWTGSERVFASIDSIDVASKSTTSRTPRDWLNHIDIHDYKDIKM